MFSEIIKAIRAYIIMILAEQVASDIATSGLNEEDQAIVDQILDR